MFIDFVTKSVRNKLLIWMLVFELVPLILLGGISYNISSSKLESELNKSNYQTIEKTALHIGTIIQRLSDFADLISKSNDLISLISNPKNTNDSAILRDKIHEMLVVKSSTFNFPVHIYVKDADDNVYSNILITSDEEQNVKRKILEEIKNDNIPVFGNSAFWVGVKENFITGYDSKRICYLTKNIIVNGENSGTIYIGVADYILSRLFNDTMFIDESQIFIFDDYKKLMFVIPETVRIDSYRESGKIKNLLDINTKPRYINFSGVNSYAAFYKTYFGWSIVMVTPISKIAEKLMDIRKATIIITIVSLLFILAFLFFANKSLIKPIVYLRNLMRMARKGDLEARSKLISKDEIGQLGEGFNKMLTDFKSMIEKAKNDEIYKKELEFKVLQSQIKPHFLYNTLNSIRWMAEMKNETELADSIVSLVKMLEYNMKGSEKLVSGSDEVEYIEEYLNLQSLRYWSKFESFIDIDKEVLNCRMLKLSLQPIIENSIVHGCLNSNKENLVIKIIGRKENECLAFHVYDNGCGICKNKIDEINNKLENREYKDKGIGLYNINNRIKMEFGDLNGIKIESTAGEGTHVCMIVPIINQKGES